MKLIGFLQLCKIIVRYIEFLFVDFMKDIIFWEEDVDKSDRNLNNGRYCPIIPEEEIEEKLACRLEDDCEVD